ncbi:BTAD domain-containing putative transcriptional regulator [Nocardioides sp. GCM10028917]|uniref:nSTAND1 domain-containing NTPase n=1 Tax=Nocardioides sp. GCM10028917 TaxID=3273408 RepID=UPI0036160AF4
MPSRLYPDVVEYGVLGSLEIRGPGGRVELRGARERLLLAHLLAAGGRAVGTSALVEGLWGDDPPRTAGKALQNIVLRVRRALEPDRTGPSRVLVTERGGYRLVVDPLGVDAGRFEAMVRSASALRADARAAELYNALGLWRGEAYGEFTEAPFVVAEARRLSELRMTAVEGWGEAELAAGPRPDLVAELERHVAEHPLRERLWSLLVRALYRQGRQGEALGALARARAVLADELGVDPGPELTDLHERVLAQDPRLKGRSAPVPVPQELRRGTGVLVGREDELAVLRDLWERTAAGQQHGTHVAVRGPAGAGARRLVAELAAEVASSGAEVAYSAFPGADSPSALLTPSEKAPGPRLLVLPPSVDAPGTGSDPLLVISIGPPGSDPRGADVVLDLPPLGREELRRVVAPIVPPLLLDEVMDEVCQHAAGLPGRARKLATAAVQRRMAEQVRTSAVRAGQAAATLAEARDEMTANVLGLTEHDEATWRDGVGSSPWPGLLAYGPAESAWFAGRERLVAEMLARLPGSTALAVVGASGSGKSSVVGAGLVASLREGRLPGSAGWTVLTMRPGTRPQGELARALLDAGRPDAGDLLERLVRAPDGSDDWWVLVVDQFEECWTECSDEAERQGFLEVLTGLITDTTSRTTLVVVLRADFLPRVAEHRELSAAFADNTVLVGTPTVDEVRRMVLRPAQRAGLVLEDGLVDAVVADAGLEPGLLPLLSTSMRRLWEDRSEVTLSLDSYVATGGLRGAIGGLAEAEYASLDPLRQAQAKALFMRLAGAGEGEEVARRRVPLEELRGLPHDVAPLVELLAEARLVTVSRGFVEVAHEALFREWPRLREWLGEGREGRMVQRRLATSVLEWHQESRDPTLLWSGSRLDAAVEVAERQGEELTELEHDFLAASRDAAAARERAAEKRVAEKTRQNRRLRMLLAGSLAFLLLALAAGALALRASDREASAARAATQAAVTADAKRLAASALSIQQPDLALLAAVEATRLERSPETYGAVLTLLGRQPDVVTRVAAPSRLMAVAANPRGQVVYLAQERPELWALDAATGRRLWSRPIDAMGITISVAPDGRRLAVLTVDRAGVVRDHVAVMDRNGEEQRRITADDVSRWTGVDVPYLWGTGWRDDGSLVVVTNSHVVVAGADGALVRAVPWGRAVLDTNTLVVWADGRVSTGPSDTGPGVVLDTSRPGRPTRTTQDTIWAVSPRADVVAATRQGAAGTELVVLDADTLRPRGPAHPLAGVVSFMRFSPTGERLAVGVDERTEVRDGTTGALRTTLLGQSSDALGADWAGPQSSRLWTAGREGTAVSFDTTGGHGVLATTPSPDQPWAGEGAVDAPVEIWSNRDDLAPNAAFLKRDGDRRGIRLPMTGLERCRCEVTSTDVTPDGRTALAGVRVLGPDWLEIPERGYVVVWDVATRQMRSVVETPWPVNGLDSSPEGDDVVLNGGAGWGVLDLDTTKLVRTGPLAQWTRAGWGSSLAEVSPSGDRAVLLRGGEVLVVDLADGTVTARDTVETDPGGTLQSAGWSDAETVAVGSSTGWLYVLDADTLSAAAPRRLLTGGPVGDIEVSPNGRVAATLEGADGDVTLWDTSSWRPYGQAVIRDHGVGFLRFEPDSSTLWAVYGMGLRARVAADPRAWVDAACEAANRGLNEDEKAVLDADLADGPTCSPGAVAAP